MNLKRLNPKFLKKFHRSNMNNVLGNVAYYSDEIIPTYELNLSSYITTDSLLTNKQGKCASVNLPPNSETCTRFKKGDILVANIRPYLKKIWLADIDGGCSADVLVFKTKEGYLTNFIYYALLRDDFFVHAMNGSTGTKMPRGDKDHLLEFLIPDFDYAQQEKISQTLSVLDAKIALNKKINFELEATAKLIYDYWFVQFDFPDKNGNPYKSSGGKMVYNEDLKRDIPERWRVKELSEIEPNIITGKTPSTTNSENFGGEVPFICIGDVRGNMHITKTEQTLSKLGANSQPKKYVPKGAICVTCIASPGLVGFTTEDSQTNQQLNTLVCNDINRYFLYFYLKDYFRFAKAKSGNTFANMNKGDFSSIKVIQARQESLGRFSNILNSLSNKILINSRENNMLEDLRDWLLPMLMNGQVKIK